MRRVVGGIRTDWWVSELSQSLQYVLLPVCALYLTGGRGPNQHRAFGFYRLAYETQLCALRWKLWLVNCGLTDEHHSLTKKKIVIFMSLTGLIRMYHGLYPLLQLCLETWKDNGVHRFIILSLMSSVRPFTTKKLHMFWNFEFFPCWKLFFVLYSYNKRGISDCCEVSLFGSFF